MSSNGTKSSVGYKNSILNSTHRRISKLPNRVCGNFRRSTYKVCTESIKSNCATGSIISILGRNSSSCKCTVCRSGGDKENTGSGRTLCTVRGRVVNLELFTGSLRKVSRRSTAITVYRIRATKIEHNLCELVHSHTRGIRFLTTVVKHNNYGAVGLDTYNRTRCRAAGMVSLILVYTILYDVTARYGNNLILPSIQICCRLDLGHLYLGNISGSGISILVKVLVDNKNRGETYVTVNVTAVIGVKEDLCIKHNEAKRFAYAVSRISGIPAKSCVHRSDYITVTVSLCVCSLLGHYACLIVTVLRNHTHVTVYNLNVFVVKIRLHYKEYLSTRSVIIV